MKVWRAYGSEHSTNLKLIGHFTDADSANAAREAIRDLTAAVEAEQKAGRMDYDTPPELFSAELIAAFKAAKVHSLSRADLGQFLYGIEAKLDGQRVVIETDEIDVIAFVKVLIFLGAKVEMYSMHDHKA